MNTVSEKEFAAYIGPNAHLYLHKFQEFDELEGRFKLSWNWSACLFTFWWFLYRKLYPWALALLVLTVIPYLNILCMIAAGCAANHLYYRQAKSQIAAVKETYPDIDPLQAAAELGGVNRWVAILGGVFCGVVLLGVAAALITPMLLHK